jgi:hypothetical protein
MVKYKFVEHLPDTRAIPPVGACGCASASRRRESRCSAMRCGRESWRSCWKGWSLRRSSRCCAADQLSPASEPRAVFDRVYGTVRMSHNGRVGSPFIDQIPPHPPFSKGGMQGIHASARAGLPHLWDWRPCLTRRGRDVAVFSARPRSKRKPLYDRSPIGASWPHSFSPLSRRSMRRRFYALYRAEASSSPASSVGSCRFMSCHAARDSIHPSGSRTP